MTMLPANKYCESVPKHFMGEVELLQCFLLTDWLPLSRCNVGGQIITARNQPGNESAIIAHACCCFPESVCKASHSFAPCISVLLCLQFILLVLGYSIFAQALLEDLD